MDRRQNQKSAESAPQFQCCQECKDLLDECRYCVYRNKEPRRWVASWKGRYTLEVSRFELGVLPPHACPFCRHDREGNSSERTGWPIGGFRALEEVRSSFQDDGDDGLDRDLGNLNSLKYSSVRLCPRAEQILQELFEQGDRHYMKRYMEV
ncbi:hypothetical protein BDZ45DRAFT_747807 [Acephala macrosclerotiorum]|nr:hypothetical protein BDZ45DRAFT_747807 [Acephala macrosclerotiorum]